MEISTCILVGRSVHGLYLTLQSHYIFMVVLCSMRHCAWYQAPDCLRKQQQAEAYACAKCGE